MLHDLDSEMVPRFQQVIWKHHAPIDGWDACSVVSNSGLVLCIVFSSSTDENPYPLWYVTRRNLYPHSPLLFLRKLLEFRLDDQSDFLYNSLSLEVPTKQHDKQVSLKGGHAPFLYIADQHLIYDVATQQFYEFLPPGPALARS